MWVTFLGLNTTICILHWASIKENYEVPERLKIRAKDDLGEREEENGGSGLFSLFCATLSNGVRIITLVLSAFIHHTSVILHSLQCANS